MGGRNAHDGLYPRYRLRPFRTPRRTSHRGVGHATPLRNATAGRRPAHARPDTEPQKGNERTPGDADHQAWPRQTNTRGGSRGRPHLTDSLNPARVPPTRQPGHLGEKRAHLAEGCRPLLGVPSTRSPKGRSHATAQLAPSHHHIKSDVSRSRGSAPGSRRPLWRRFPRKRTTIDPCPGHGAALRRSAPILPEQLHRFFSTGAGSGARRACSCSCALSLAPRASVLLPAEWLRAVWAHPRRDNRIPEARKASPRRLAWGAILRNPPEVPRDHPTTNPISHQDEKRPSLTPVISAVLPFVKTRKQQGRVARRSLQRSRVRGAAGCDSCRRGGGTPGDFPGPWRPRFARTSHEVQRCRGILVL